MNESQKVPVMVRLPQESVDRLDEAAREDGRSRAGMARVLLERALNLRGKGWDK